MNTTILEFLENQSNGFMVLTSEDLGGHTKGDVLVVKLDDFTLVHYEGGNRIHVYNTFIEDFIGTMRVDCLDDFDLSELGEELGDWYHNHGGKTSLRVETIEYLNEIEDTTDEELLKDLEEAMEDLNNIVDKVANEYLKGNRKR